MNKIKKITAFLLMLTLIFSGSVALAFNDTWNHWALEHINWAADNGLIKGEPGGNFRPDGAISKAELYAVVNRLTGSTKTSLVTFSDVKPGDWFYEDVGKAIGYGYIKGELGNLNPNESIKRGEVARIIGTVYGLTPNNLAANRYSDNSNFALNEAGMIGALSLANVLNGYDGNLFKAENTITRAEVAKVIRTAIDRLGFPKGVPSANIVNGRVYYNGRYYSYEEYAKAFNYDYTPFPSTTEMNNLVVNVYDRFGNALIFARVETNNNERSTSAYAGQTISLPSGIHRFTVTMTGYEPYNGEVNLSGFGQTINITLLPTGSNYGDNVQGQYGYYGAEPTGNRIKIIYQDTTGKEIISPSYELGDVGEVMYIVARDIDGYELLSNRTLTPSITGDRELDTVTFRYQRSYN